MKLSFIMQEINDVFSQLPVNCIGVGLLIVGVGLFVGCEAGCLKCQTSEDRQNTVCLECPQPMIAFDNICVRQCPIGHFNQSFVCQSKCHRDKGSTS